MTERDWMLELLENHPNAPATNSMLLRLGQEMRSGFRTVDRRFERNEALLEGVAAQVATLTLDVATLKTDVATLKTDVATLKTDVGVLKTDVGTLKSGVQRILQILENR